MLQEERCSRIMELLRQNRVVKVVELTNDMGVSLDTIRRDLELLDGKGMLRRVHGGAVLESDSQNRTEFSHRVISNLDKKTEVADKIIKHIKEKDFIAMNAGTTNIEIAKKIAERFEQLTILTNNLRVIDVFSHKDKFKIIIPGGILDTEELSLYGRECIDNISQYNVNIAIITTNAVSIEKGITDFRYFEIGIIKAMIAASQKTIVAVDSTKLERVASMNVYDITQIDALCTDSGAPANLLEKYLKCGIKIL